MPSNTDFTLPSGPTALGNREVLRTGVPATREQWLADMINALRVLFQERGISLPEGICASCGFPHGRRGSRKQVAIGQCWARRASGANRSEIFISPVLDNGLAVAAVLVHELVHAVDDCRNGHLAVFRKMALAVGLAGPMRATHAGPELAERLNALCLELGQYPHARLDPTQASAAKQKTRLIKVVCDRSSCGYALWTTRTWLDLGTPNCVCGSSTSEIARRR